MRSNAGRWNGPKWVLAGLFLLLAGCMLMPGKFTSSLDLRRDATFAYAYSGEIVVMALSDFARNNSRSGPFRPTPCYGENGNDERPCSKDEIAAQRKSWEDARRSSEAERSRERDSMKAILGGIDLEDPRAAHELAARMRGQAGWRKAEYIGNGTFLVDFAISGQLRHDFTFPTIERFPLANPFVQISLRRDGTVRVDAPGFGPGGQGSPWSEMVLGAAASASGEKDNPRMPAADGSLVLRTDGAILANNTNDGPAADPAGQRLDWRVGPGITAAPMALIRLK